MIDLSKYLDEQYKSLSRYSYKQNCQILYNIIHVKARLKIDYNESLYIDAKKFVKAYLNAIDNEDFGYDHIQITKIIDISNCLDIKQKLFFLYNVNRLLQVKGFDTNILSKEIVETETTVAWREKHWFIFIRLWLSSSLIKLVIVYFFYILIVGVILLPAPFPWMSLFDISMHNYSSNAFLNHCSNTLALITGNDIIAPQVVPNGFVGMIVYCVGVVAFYLVFVNYVFRKIEDFIKLK